MKKDVLIAIAAVLAIFAIAYGLSAVRPAVTPTAAPDTGITNKGPLSSDTVVMRVNGEPVTEREFTYFVSSLPEQMQAFFNNPTGRRQMAEQYIRMKVLEQEAQKLGVEKDPDIQARMKFGHTNLAVDWAVQKIAGDTSDAQLRAAYDKERQKFVVTELRHILIAYKGGRVPPAHGQAPSPEEAMARAQKVAADLHAGASFADVAKKVSDDSGSAAQGGVIGAVPRGSLPPEMERVVETLKTGQISDPVRSEFGIHIFLVDGRRPQAYEEVKPMLQRDVQQTTVNQTVERLQKAAKVDLDPKYFVNPPKPAPPAPGQPAPTGTQR